MLAPVPIFMPLGATPAHERLLERCTFDEILQ
jgi:hypothetical protein